MADSKTKVGEITKSYDPPTCPFTPFQMGFKHDISLVTATPGQSLPALASPDGAPAIKGWGSYKDVLDGSPVFVTGQVVNNGYKKPREGRGVAQVAQQALMEGLEYLWDQKICSVDVSLLWRTQYEWDRLGGMSGAVLCTGYLKDRECKAVVFQNFELPCRPGLLAEHYGGGVDVDNRPTIKGGFLLPPEIRRATIICDEDPEANHKLAKSTIVIKAVCSTLLHL